MSAKQITLASIRDLPDDATFAQIRERVALLAGIDEAEERLRREGGVPHGEVVERFEAWSKEWHSKSSGRPRRSKTSVNN